VAKVSKTEETKVETTVERLKSELAKAQEAKQAKNEEIAFRIVDDWEIKRASNDLIIKEEIFDLNIKVLDAIWDSIIEASDGNLVERLSFGFGSGIDKLTTIARTLFYANKDNQSLEDLVGISKYQIEIFLDDVVKLPYYSPKLDMILNNEEITSQQVENMVTAIHKFSSLLKVKVDVRKLTLPYIKAEFKGAVAKAGADMKATRLQMELENDIL